MNILTKLDENTSNKFGTIPNERSFEELLDKGFVIIDKNSGPTSHETTDFVKKILGINKAGHSGTLDPAVTGVLLTGLGRATRLMEYMLKSNKEYVCLMYLHQKVDEKTIKDALKHFTGEITQIPPSISAVKREPRKRIIYSIEILDIDNQNVLFRVACQHGTYIRKLCTDIGDYIGCKAQMKELRRTKAGPYTEFDNSISLDKLRNLFELYKKDSKYESELRKYIRPMEDVLKDFKKIYVRDSAVDTLCHGADLAIPGISKTEEGIKVGEEVAIFTLKGELIAMGVSYLTSKQIITKKRGAVVKTEKVFMDSGTYPSVWEFKKEYEQNKFNK